MIDSWLACKTISQIWRYHWVLSSLQLPYACYSSTQVASPILARATSLEGRASPYAPSSATYQSIEGLTEDYCSGRRDDSRCNNCGSRASTISSKRTGKSYHHRSHYECRHHRSGRSKSSHSSSSQLSAGVHSSCCSNSRRTPMSQGNPHNYAPNFYGWMSPPASPRVVFPPFECEGFSMDGESLYGGSADAKSELGGGGGEYSWCRTGGSAGSFYGGGSSKSEEEDRDSKSPDNLKEEEENENKETKEEVDSTSLPPPPPELVRSPTHNSTTPDEGNKKLDNDDDDCPGDSSPLSPVGDTDLSKLLASCDKQTKLWTEEHLLFLRRRQEKQQQQ